MFSLETIVIVLTSHWIADFILQTDAQAKAKSSDNSALTAHVKTYCAFMLLPAFYLMYPNPMYALAWVGMNGLFHWAQDYWTSRLNTYLWKKGDVHNFFVSVGFDQLIHYFLLFATLKSLM